LTASWSWCSFGIGRRLVHRHSEHHDESSETIAVDDTCRTRAERAENRPRANGLATRALDREAGSYAGFCALRVSRCLVWDRPLRPVTPEVAGSSPVAPVKIPANQHVVLSDLTAAWRRLHTLFSSRRRNGQRPPETQSRGDALKPIQAESDRPRRPRAITRNGRRYGRATARRPCRKSRPHRIREVVPRGRR
jgi:hypothetical protein